MPMDRFEVGTEARKFRGRGNWSRGNNLARGGRGMKGQMFLGREKFRDKFLNDIVPIRRGMGRMRPYPDPRGRGESRGRHPGFIPPHPTREMREPFSPPPLRHGHPPPSGPMGFRGRPPHPRGRGMLPPPAGHFYQPRGVT
ncbi:hypothetical protein FKM82_010266 [Ascaphus truei]